MHKRYRHLPLEVRCAKAKEGLVQAIGEMHKSADRNLKGVQKISQEKGAGIAADLKQAHEQIERDYWETILEVLRGFFGSDAVDAALESLGKEDKGN